MEPPKGRGKLALRDARFAWLMLLPTVIIVSLVVILPLFAIFWISVKPIDLGDLRPTTLVIRENVRTGGEVFEVDYRVRNSSQEAPIADAGFTDMIPSEIELLELPENCSLSQENNLDCDFGDIQGGFRERFRIPATITGSPDVAVDLAEESQPRVRGDADSVLTNTEFTLDNFRKLFDQKEFITVLWTTLFYTFFGTVGALVFGLFAALLLNTSFRGQGILRGFFLFPYVAPVIAVAFTWINLLDPFSGSINTLIVQMGLTEEAINFFGQRPLALIMVTLFEVWRYFPLSFLFILARMQAIDFDMYEAADMDGASPFQKFWYLSIPQLLGILSILFLLRFIWTFNKFDDIFLLTGGNAGTRTLTVNVYEQAFGISNIGAGAAVAVIIMLFLLLFSFFFFRFISQEEGL
ncbi:MAG: sugar ABC transporter permease [Rhodobacteraceae bacterium]|nr:sugar ABC transporter permease [Paracoccaceae bacterium]MCY4251169.1 sugar ABC transporter permease [Paracoccaceae bacterium]MCY4307292.1 sugar ABC transporter permease [Paracoccaceae bacterium]